MSTLLVWAGIGLGVWIVGGILIYFGRRAQSKTNLLKRVPTIPAAEVNGSFPGELVEIKGTIRTDSPLTSQIAERPCVWFRSTVTREYERRDRNSKGEWQTNRGSETVSTTELSTGFGVEDASGRAYVEPDGADFQGLKVVDRFEQATDDSGPTISISGLSIDFGGTGSRTLGYRYAEEILPVDSPVYVLGTVQEGGVIGRATNGGRDHMFLISNRTEEVIQKQWSNQARWLAYSALGAALLGAILIIIGIVLLVA